MQESVNKFEKGNYTYNAGGDDRLESFVYPSGLLTVKTLPEMNNQYKMIATYTKHYYIGAERIASVIGTGNSVGYNICNNDFPTGAEVSALQQKVTQAGTILQEDYDFFEKHLSLSSPFVNQPGCGMSYIGKSNAFWFHPDHTSTLLSTGLGSSSYISNNSGEISQHLECFPFGETLVEEHKNSNNSPYKFNAKELDNETGNYYYGARYYNPKWSIWLSVDPLAEKYMSLSPYSYTANNPINYTDPDGREIDVTALKKKNSKQSKWLLRHLQSSLSEISGQEIFIEKKGSRFILKGSGPCDADCTLASAYISHLLESEEIIKVFSTKSGSQAFPKQFGLTARIFLDAAQIKGVQNGLIKAGLNSKTLSVGLGFLHETLHTRLGLSFFKEVDELSNQQITENDLEVLQRINKFRQEINSDYPLRVNYYKGGFRFINKQGKEEQIKYDKSSVIFKSPRDF